MGEVALLFSGQGAQYPGMGQDLYDNSTAAREVYDTLEAMRPGIYVDLGSMPLGLSLSKSVMRSAGARKPGLKADLSIPSMYLSTRNGSEPSISSLRISVTMPLLQSRPPRDEGDMPLTESMSSSVAAGTTRPPGHMQKE